MKTENVVGLALLAGAGFVAWRWYQSQQPVGRAITGGVLQPPGGWGAAPAVGQVYDPEVYAGGVPSRAGSNGSGNLNPATSIVSAISNILRGLSAGPNASAPIAGYGKPAAPATPGGPTSATPAGTGFLPLNRGVLVDPVGQYGDLGWLLPSQNITEDYIWNAAPPDISSQAIGDYGGIGITF